MNIEIAIPCYNEDQGLVQNIEKIHSYCQNNLTDPWQIIIADNGSTDDTYIIAQGLEKKLPHIKTIHFDQKGRGQTLKKVWQKNGRNTLILAPAGLLFQLLRESSAEVRLTREPTQQMLTRM